MQASDISEDRIYKLVLQAQYPSLGQNLDAICAGLAPFSRKLVLAKLRQMVNGGRLRGCVCGCRGDFSIPAAIVDGWRARLNA